LNTTVSHSDVLIVGAGSAGSVVAERLSADPSRSVTMLEAGPGLTDPWLLAQTTNGLRLPIGTASQLVVRYQAQLTQRPARQVSITRGATIGGSGAINGGNFCRGLPRDFDGYELPGWTWSDVVDHFRAIETDLDFPGVADHGDAGPIPVQRSTEFTGSTAGFVDAAEKAGFVWLADLNDSGVSRAMPSGVGAVPLNIVDGVRTGPGAAYLLPAMTRANLTLLTRTRAVRLRFTGSHAAGVDAIGPRGPITVTADRIVLCAGAIESAHLLMISGIGDEAMLHAAGVDVTVPLPVGTGCSDHPEWVLPTSWATASGRPVLEVILNTSNIEIRPYTGGFAEMTGDETGGRYDWPHIGVVLMRPKARGRITLFSADPEVRPGIEYRYDSAPEDIAALRRGTELARELAGGQARVGEALWSTSQHLCGSAPMGVDGDPRAVVDPRCRVYGIEDLWVIDGSVLPTVTSRGPHATIVMLGHRAAEFVS
jgi:predicted dehydrogenase (TIGR03970 family)